MDFRIRMWRLFCSHRLFAGGQMRSEEEIRAVLEVLLKTRQKFLERGMFSEGRDSGLLRDIARCEWVLNDKGEK